MPPVPDQAAPHAVGQYAPPAETPLLTAPLVDPREPLPRWLVALLALVATGVFSVAVAWTTATRTIAEKEDASAHARDMAELRELRRIDSAQAAADRAMNRETHDRVRAIYCAQVPAAISAGCR